MSYTANGVKFDATPTWIQIDSGQTFGSSQPRRGTLGIWLYTETAPPSGNRIMYVLNAGGSPRMEFEWNGTNGILFFLRNSAGTIILNWTSANNFIPVTTWTHVAIAWDLATSTFQVFKNGVDQAQTPTTITSADVDWVNCVRGFIAGSAHTTAIWIADLYLNTEERLDLTANISQLCIPAGGYAVDPGSNGALVTGTQPEVMLTGTTAGWNTNKGTAGGYNITSPGGGALTDADTDPPSAPDDTKSLIQVIHANVGMRIRPIGY